MADEVNAAAEAEQKAEASFGEGFGATVATDEVAKEVAVETKTESVVEPPAATPPADAPPPADPSPPDKRRWAKIRVEEFDKLKLDAGQVPHLQREVARLANVVNNTSQMEQRIVEKLKTQAPAGLSVEMSDEDFAELAAEVPEIAKLTRTALERVFKKAGVRGAEPATAPTLRDEDLDKALDRREAKKEADAFIAAYPKWREITGAVDAEKGEVPDPANPFRMWLDTQPEEFKHKVNNTTSVRELHSAIDKFMASKTAPPPAPKPDRAAARRAIMEDAVTPRTDGSPPSMRPPPSAEDAFAQGYAEARGKQMH